MRPGRRAGRQAGPRLSAAGGTLPQKEDVCAPTHLRWRSRRLAALSQPRHTRRSTRSVDGCSRSSTCTAGPRNASVHLSHPCNPDAATANVVAAATDSTCTGYGLTDSAKLLIFSRFESSSGQVCCELWPGCSVTEQPETVQGSTSQYKQQGAPLCRTHPLQYVVGHVCPVRHLCALPLLRSLLLE